VRIVSLLASGTEIVCALGAGDMLVGRSHECDNPPWVRSLPCCSAPAFDVSGSSAEINAEVTRRIRAREPLYKIHTALIEELAPDLVITQSHCDVCAVTPADLERQCLHTSGLHTLALQAGSLAGICADILAVANAIGREPEGQALLAREQERLQNVKTRTTGLPPPSVVMLEWIDPLFAMGNWGPELVELANANLLLSHKGSYSSIVSANQLLAADPEHLIVAPCGFSLDRALRELPVLQALPFWPQLRAVKAGKVAFADGNLFFNRSGVTIPQTAEIIAEILHGLVFNGPARNLHWVTVN
jgi:iron complex transport system substrate-binding protein